ncbi:MAG: glycosyltransferase [Geminicoccaceae bacterium]|nr:glycosyltransferase [Geminicoccaceae bacterium]
MLALALLALALASLPLGLGLVNLRLFRPPPPASGRPAVSVLIPARNEAANIGDALAAVLASRGVELEALVLDDHSSDGTGGVVAAFTRRDPRVRLHHAPPLPEGWNGKQHACHVLGSLARYPVLVFVDADVRLAPDALAGAAAFLKASGASLVSGFPREVAVGFMERMLVPLIHLLLLGYLPIALMRKETSPGLGAGCGQLMVADRDAYRAVGGHGAIGESRHDGLKLPRLFRRHGYETDLFDATGLARCRMYDGAGAAWNGFLKNAGEGMASPVQLPVWTVLLFGGHVLPWLLLPAALLAGAWWAVAVAALAVAANLALRAALARRFRQHWLGVALHPLAVLLTLVLQWQALFQGLAGRRVAWRGR